MGDYDYQWERRDSSGANPVDVPGESGSVNAGVPFTYPKSVSDDGHVLTARVTRVADGVVVTSNPIGPIVAGSAVAGIYQGVRDQGSFWQAHYGAPNSDDMPWSASTVGGGYDLWTTHVGKPPSCVHWGGPGGTLPTSFDQVANQRAHDRGAFSAYSVEASTQQVKDLANNDNTRGALSLVTTWASQAAVQGYPILARFCREMNANFSSPEPWQPVSGISAATYVAAFKKWASLVRAAAPNVSVVFCPNVYNIGDTNIFDPTPWNPGVQDWNGMDGYCHSSYQSPSAIFDNTYSILGEGLPIVIFETGVEAPTTSPGKAAWITDYLGTWLPAHSAVRASIWFDRTGNPVLPYTDVGDAATDFYPSSAAATAYATGLGSSYYLGAVAGSFPLHLKVPIP